MCLFEHLTNMVSMSPCFFRKKHTLMTFANENYYEDLKRDAEGYSLTIENDVWIGSGVDVKSGRWWEKDINWFQENAVHFKDIDEFMRCLSSDM